MYYISTRGNKGNVISSEAIIKGICDDGGLFVPDKFPDLCNDLSNLLALNYTELAFIILSKFLTDFPKDDLIECIENAYNNKFNNYKITPVTKVGDVHFLELYHGPTLAFKDLALTLLPYLLKVSLHKNNVDKEVLILTATSGDTGKAALEGFRDIPGISIAVFYPEEGVSNIQKLQMKTQEGNNTYVCGIKGNFDDAQSGVKNIFNNKIHNDYLYNNGYLLSSANSINIGRLLPQIVYYFSSYFDLVNNGEIKLYEKVNFVVPTGNFGNILAGYYALKLGLPINKLICASNENNVLYDFFKSGTYNKNRNLKLTNSPSMDILISSNLERLLFEISNRNSDVINDLFSQLSTKGYYTIDDSMKNNLSNFYGEFSTQHEVNSTIEQVYKEFNYVIDTHTAIAYNCYKKYKSTTNDKTKSIVLSTASPFKFANDIVDSIKNKYDNNPKSEIKSEFDVINELSSIANLNIPKQISDLSRKKILHNNTIQKTQIHTYIDEFIINKS